MSFLVNPFLQAAGSSPVDVAGLQFWHKPETLTALADDDPVSQWDDSSGNGWHLTSSGANRPKYKTNVVGGHGAVFYDDAAAYFLQWNLSAFSALTAAEIFIVLKNTYDPPATAEGTGLYVVSGEASNAVHYPNSDKLIYSRFGTGTRVVADLPDGALTSWHVYNSMTKSGTYRHRRTAGPVAFRGTNTVSWGGTPKIGVNGAGNRYSGHVAEIICYDHELSDADRATVYAYLENKYGIGVPDGTIAGISGLQLHVKADQITASDNDPISTWADQSGNSRDLTQSGSARPVYKTNIFGSLPALQFTAASLQYFDIPNFMSAYTAAEIFVAIKINTDPPATSAATGLWRIGTSGSGSSGHFPFTDGVIYESALSSARFTLTDPAQALTSPRLYSVAAKASYWVARIDGYSAGTQWLKTSLTVALTTAPTLGKSVGAQYLDGYVGELLMFNRVLTDLERANVIKYLADKWGVT